MNCPKCGHQNPDDIKVCESCGCDFSESKTPQPIAKTSKLAIFSLVLAISSLLFFVFTGLPAMLYGLISLKKIRKSEGNLKGKSLAKAGLFLPIPLMCIFFLIWRMDAPPISNDYTINDLRSAPADCAESYELLRKLIYLFADPRVELNEIKNFIAFAENVTGHESQMKVPEDFLEKYLESDDFEPLLSIKDINIINEVTMVIDKGTASEITNILNKNDDIIKQAWDKTQKARDIIHQLNEFPEIADLQNTTDQARLHTKFPLMNLAKLYCAYTYLQTEPGDIHIITNDLITLDSTLKKANLNARSLVSKLVYLTMIERNITTANAIANNSGTSQESVELLAKHLIPITEQQISLNNPAIHAYLFLKDNIVRSPELTIFKSLSLFKENSTLRVLKNKCDDSLNTLQADNELQKERLSVWPNFYPFKEASLPDYNEEPISFFHYPYTWYNPVGTIFGTTEGFEKLAKQKKSLIKTKKIDNLLRIVLMKRLGEEEDFTSRDYNDEYFIDIENKYIVSPGQDEKVGTKDDIKLPINPEVLGFTK